MIVSLILATWEISLPTETKNKILTLHTLPLFQKTLPVGGTISFHAFWSAAFHHNQYAKTVGEGQVNLTMLSMAQSHAYNLFLENSRR